MHHFDTVVGSTSNSFDNHLLVRFFSLSTVFNLLIFGITLYFKYKDSEKFSSKTSHTLIFASLYRNLCHNKSSITLIQSDVAMCSFSFIPPYQDRPELSDIDRDFSGYVRVALLQVFEHRTIMDVLVTHSLHKPISGFRVTSM